VRGRLDYVTGRRDLGEDRDYPALGWGVKATYAPTAWLELFHEPSGAGRKSTDSHAAHRPELRVVTPIDLHQYALPRRT